MQSVNEAFSAEEVDSDRLIAHSLQVSWKKFVNSGDRPFTVGSSTIGGPDGIGGIRGQVANPTVYQYADESDYAQGLAWERKLNQPIGGLSRALAEARLDNTSGRYTPRYIGGNGELFTAQLPRRPLIINAGFKVDGIDVRLPQFAGITTKTPKLDGRNRTVQLEAADHIDFLQNRYLDQQLMFTSQRTDEVINTLLTDLGIATAQYELDYGINIIPFGLFEKGSRFSDIIHELVQAENGQFYQDEEGIFRFENRQHYDNYPHFNVQRVITTAQVINYEVPNDSHLINVVEVRSQVRSKQPEQVIFRSSQANPIALEASTRTEVFIDFEDPVMSLTTPTNGGAVSFFTANSEPDDSGTDLASSVSVTKVTKFAKAAILEFTNSAGVPAYLTELVVSGRPAKITKEIYYREQDDSSVTAYEERPYAIENDYIQSDSWAKSFARMVLNDFSDIENIQTLTIRAIPELQLGDLISWQGRYWRIYGIKAGLDPSSGFVQELQLLQRTLNTYFRIGLSLIGGTDQIAP